MKPQDREVLVHKMRQLELRFKLFYLLRDLGVRAAFEPAAVEWHDYMHKLSSIIADGKNV